MGFTKPDLPAVDPDTFMQQPLMDRMKVLALHWAENGFGTPRMVHTIYIAKLLFFYILGGVVVATTSSRLRPASAIEPPTAPARFNSSAKVRGVRPGASSASAWRSSAARTSSSSKKTVPSLSAGPRAAPHSGMFI